MSEPITMNHLNGDLMCAMDTETTGLDPNFHEVIQIAIVPLNYKCDVRKDVLPFFINLKPDFPERADPEAMKINGLAGEMQGAFDRIHAIDLLKDWIDKLKIPYSKYGTPKRIVPLGQNYSFDKPFIASWLGRALYDEWFSPHYRDTMHSALYLNDRASFHAHDPKFHKVNLTWLCKVYNVDNPRAHNALSDCCATAAVYKKMCMEGVME